MGGAGGLRLSHTPPWTLRCKIVTWGPPRLDSQRHKPLMIHFVKGYRQEMTVRMFSR